MRLLLIVSVSALGLGCSLNRSPIVEVDAPGVDAPPRDGGDRDVPLPPLDAPGCDPARCDDANPCTDDLCGTTGACEHPPNSAACDDGLFCTTNDRCVSGACTGNDGPPCPACREDDDTCGTCVSAADCPLPAEGPCTFADVCSLTGSSTVTTYTCPAGTCVASTTSETCIRDTNGTMCGSRMVSMGDCAPVGMSPCSTEGLRSVVTTDFQCIGGVCAAIPVASPEACNYDPVGAACSGCAPPGTCNRAFFGACSGTAMAFCGAGTCTAADVCTVSGGSTTAVPCFVAASAPCRSVTCGPCNRVAGPSGACAETCNGIPDGVCDGAGTCNGTTGTFTRPCFGCPGS